MRPRGKPVTPISDVLRTAEGLVAEESWAYVTPDDAALLTLATLLHDSAMHLQPDGFLALVFPSAAQERPLVELLDLKTWPELFEQYIADARRWDERTLYRILGDRNSASTGAASLDIHIRRPNETAEEWPKPYRKFIGEFIRRHHARLAHEIALFGVPAHTTTPLRLDGGIPRRTADLAGLVARSHWLDIRATFPYLRRNYGQRVICQNSHPVFLMALLRIADYLQIQASRANAILLRTQRLESEISQVEYDKHFDVCDVQRDEDDPEAIYVHALPKTATVFLGLQRLLQGLQSELDHSWAVLGEVFGRQGDLRALALVIRRVRSNIDDPAAFLATNAPKYYPLRARFDTAGADLLKLLIRPLYGDSPTIGIRELIQNSVDAVLERRQYYENHPRHPLSARANQAADIVVSVESDEDGQFWLVVEDSGIGMLPETIRDYYLKAGASFRRAVAWTREFERENKSLVLRSGRFGIGVLSAFLLGERIEVTTRHVSVGPAGAVRFCASILDDAIELERHPHQNIGTKIRIMLSDTTRARLGKPDLRRRSRDVRESWDWFVLTDPVVVRKLGSRRLRQRWHLPSPGSDLPPGWHRVLHPGFREVHWTYGDAPGLTCNGIIVQEHDDLVPEPMWADSANGYSLGQPKLSVFDPDGRLPLNLDRSGLSEQTLPFLEQLIADATRDFISYCLVFAPTSLPGGIPDVRRSLPYPGLVWGSADTWRDGPSEQWFYTRDGTSFLDRSLFLAADLRSALLFTSWQQDAWLAGASRIAPYQALIPLDPIQEINWYHPVPGSPVGGLYFPELFHVSGRRILVDRRIGAGGSVLSSKFAKKERSRYGYTTWSLGKCPEPVASFSAISRYLAQHFEVGRSLVEPRGAECYVGNVQPRRPVSPIAREWLKVLKKPVIPYDVSTRKRVFADAYEVLSPYVVQWESRLSELSRDPTLNSAKDPKDRSTGR